MLLCSHILSEVEALCDRVTMTRAGRTVDSGALADLRHLSRTSVRAKLTRPPQGLEGLPGLHGLDIEGTRVSCQADNSALERAAQAAGGRGSAQPGQPAADAGGAVPAALHGRARPGGAPSQPEARTSR